MTAIHDVFYRGGYKTPEIIQIFKANPLLAQYSPENISNRLEIWRGCSFGEDLTKALVIQCPEILDIDDEKFIKNRLAEIKTYAQRDKNVWRILMASPNVLVEGTAAFDEKIKYLWGVMKIEMTDAVKSGVFSYSIRKLRTRHMMMVRLGIYKERPKNYNPLDPNKNPRMARIIDSTDEEFANKICGISLFEYETFCELYAREMRNMRQKTGDWHVDNLSDDELEDDSEDSDTDADENVDDIVDYENVSIK